jgi:hypothetical protein
LTAWSHISTVDARRVSMMVNSIPSAVRLCTRIAGSIEMRGRERELAASDAMVFLRRCYGVLEEIRRG